MKVSTELKFEQLFRQLWNNEPRVKTQNPHKKHKELLKRCMLKLALGMCVTWVMIFSLMLLDFVPALGFSNTSFTLTFMNGSEIFEQITLNIDNPELNLEYIPTRSDNYFVGWYIDTGFNIPFNINSFTARSTVVYAGFKAYADTVIDYVRTSNSYSASKEPITLRYDAENQTAIAEYISYDMIGNQAAYEHKFSYDIRSGNGTFEMTLLMDGVFNSQYLPPDTVLQSIEFNIPINYNSFTMGGSVGLSLSKFEIEKIDLGTVLEFDIATPSALLNSLRTAATVNEIVNKYFSELNAGTSKAV